MLIKHSLIYIVSRLLPGILALTTTMVLTRLLDPQRYGLYGLSLVVMTFGSTIGFGWLPVSLLRFSQSGYDESVVVNTVIQLFLVVVGITAALLLLAWFMGLLAGLEAPAYVLGCFLMWALSWFELVSQFEIGSFRPRAYFIMSCGRSGAVAIGAIGAAWLTGDPIWTAGGTASGMLAAGFLGRVRNIRLGPRAYDRVLARELLAFGLPLAIVYLVSSGVNAGSRALVEWLGSPYALGLYTAAFLLVQNTLAVIASAIALAGYSMAVRAVESGDAEEAQRQILANGTLLLAVLAPASLGMALTARGIATLMVAPEYVSEVQKLTPWMAAGAFFASIRAHFFDHAFQLTRRPTMLIWIGGVSAILTIVLTYLLMPRLGPVGAAIAVTVAMAVSCIHSGLAGRSGYPMPMPISPAIRITAACLGMTVVVLALRGSTTWDFLMQAALGGLTYGLLALVLNVLDSRNHLRVWLSLRTQRTSRSTPK